MKTRLQEAIERVMQKQAAEEVEAPKAEGKPEVAPEVKDSPTPNTQPDAAKEEPTGFLSTAMATLLSTQLGNEMYSMYAYYLIAGWFQAQGLDGFMKWSRGQGDGELGHFTKVYDYLLESNQAFKAPSLEAPPCTFGSVKEAMDTMLKLEKTVTNDWRKIHAQAMSDKDAASMTLAGAMVAEQMEEENAVFTLLQRVMMADKNGILVIDCSLMK